MIAYPSKANGKNGQGTNNMHGRHSNKQYSSHIAHYNNFSVRKQLIKKIKDYLNKKANEKF